MTEHEDKDRLLIASGTLEGIRPVFVGESQISGRYAEFKKNFSDTQAYRLFAEPVYRRSGSQSIVDWLTEYQGTVTPFDKLSESEQETVKWRLKEQVDALRKEADNWSEDSRALFLKVLNSALEIPELSDIYLVGDQIVLTRWGFVKDEHRATKGIVLRILKERPLTPMMIHVTDTDNYPGKNIMTRIRYGDKLRDGITDENGFVIFDQVPIKAGVVISVELPDQSVVEESVICDADRREYLIVIPRPVFRPRLSMKFRVTDSENHPANNLELTIYYQGKKSEQVTTADGTAIFHEIPEKSSVKAVVSLPDRKPVESSVVCEKNKSEYLIIIPGVLQPKSAMTFRVVNADKKPLAGLSLKLGYRGQSFAMTTDADGVCVFKEIPVGEIVSLLITVSDKKQITKKFKCEAQDHVRLIVIRSWKFLWWLLLLLLLLLLGFLLFRSCKVPVTVGNIHIQVIDKISRQPLKDADVKITFPGKELIGKTDSNGKVNFSDVIQGGSISIDAQKMRYQDKHQIFTCCADQTVEMTPVLENKGTAAITVIDKISRQPLKDSRVILKSSDKELSLTTDSNGKVRFDDLTKGEPVSIDVKKENYQDNRQSFTCCTDQTVEMMPAVQKRGIALKVIDKHTRQPLKDAEVRVGFSGGELTGKTDSDGKLSFGDLPKDEKITIYTKKADYEDHSLAIEKCCPDEQTVEMLSYSKGGLRGGTGELKINLKWASCDDVDLHVIDTCENRIYFSKKQAACENYEGVLDVDANAGGGGNCINPEENIFFATASPGRYKVQVMLYAKKSGLLNRVPYTVTVIKNNQRSEYHGKLIREKQTDDVVIVDIPGTN